MRTGTRRPLCMRTLLCALALPCLLAACGSGTHSSPAADARTTITRTVTRTVSAPRKRRRTTTTRSTPSTTSTPPQPGDQCVASDLALSFLGGTAATGHGELGFALRNTSSGSCRTGGYPGVLFLDAAGRALTTVPDHTTSDFFGHTVLQELTVAPGATVSFRLGVSHVGSGGSNAGCVTARSVQIIAPNDTATMRVSVRSGIAECGGAVTVSPIQPGTTAFR